VDEPRPRHGAHLAILVLAAVVLVVAETTGYVSAAFSRATASTGNELVAAADFVAPASTASVVQKVEGGASGYIRQGGSYRIYATVTDTGNPASGLKDASGEISAISSGQSTSALSSGTFPVDGQTYNLRSGSLAVRSPLAAATYGYGLALSDAAGNTRTQSGLTVIVDNTAPAGSNIGTSNSTGNTVGRPERGDAITFTYNEPIDANSVLAGWAGLSTAVVVRIADNSATAGGNDALTVFNAANTLALPLGTVNLGRNDYVFASATFGATGTPSGMTRSANAITVTLGTASSGPRTAGGTGTMLWTPSNVATDRAGNLAGTVAVRELDIVDREF
jgi:hypothetical protein